MEQTYNVALRKLRTFHLRQETAPDYREQLFNIGWFYQDLVKSPEKAEIKLEELPKTEKVQVLESFNDFSKNLLDKTNSEKVILDNIEIKKKSESTDSLFQNIADLDTQVLASKLNKIIPDHLTKQRYEVNGLNKFSLNKLKVIFVADTLLKEPVKKENELDEFLTLFNEETSILFSRMVKAMKLGTQDYLLTAITSEHLDDSKGNFLEYVLNEIQCFKPTLIITLGVSASHALIETKERLQNIHGQFFNLQATDFSTEVMPLFSPSLLQSAPHMKSITWVDMQKAMEKLN